MTKRSVMSMLDLLRSAYNCKLPNIYKFTKKKKKSLEQRVIVQCLPVLTICNIKKALFKAIRNTLLKVKSIFQTFVIFFTLPIGFSTKYATV